MQQPPYDPNNQFPFQGNYPSPPSQQPGQSFYQQPTIQGYPTVPPPTPKKPNAWQRYRSARKRTQLGIGCGILFVALLLCICPVAAIGAANPQKNVAQLPTATAAPATHIAIVTTHVPTHQTTKPTALPTLKPTDTPEPTPTVAPTEVPTAVPTVAPTAIPTQVPVATQAPTQPPAKTGLYGNPWGYDLTAPGNLIYNPPADICTYFNCIASFWKSTNGYVDECADGTYSHSGGVRGACSRHGGEAQPLYSH